MRNYSNFSYVHYIGADAWGVTDEQARELNEEFEAKIEGQFPGIEIRTTLNPYHAGVICPRERCELGPDMELGVSAIAEDMLAELAVIESH